MNYLFCMVEMSVFRLILVLAFVLLYIVYIACNYYQVVLRQCLDILSEVTYFWSHLRCTKNHAICEAVCLPQKVLAKVLCAYCLDY